LQHAGTGGDKAQAAQSLRLGAERVGGFRVSGTRAETGDPTSRALARLEQAVERLAEAAAQPRPAEASGEGIPRAAVAAIADRLDETIARLRAALGEDQ
jgi:hypothetical protein